MDLKVGIKDIFTLNNNVSVKILEVLFFFASFSIPFSYAFNSICFGLLFVYSFNWFEKSKFSFSMRRVYSIHLLFIAYFIIQFIGIFYTDNQERGLNYVLKNVILLILPITFINLSKVFDKRKLFLSFSGLIIGLLFVLFSAHLNIIFKIINNDLGLKSLFTQFVRVGFVNKAIVEIHPPYFALLVVFSVVLMFKINLNVKKSLEVVIKNIMMLYLILSLYQISSFMSMLLLCFLILLYIFYLIKYKKLTKLILVMTVFLTIIFIGKISFNKGIKEYSGGTLFKRIEWSFLKGKGDTSRPENWESVLKVSKNNFLFGIGSDGGIEKLQKHRNEISESFKNKHNAHNQYLEVLLRFGIIGLSLFLIIVYKLFQAAFDSRDKSFCWFIIVCSISFITESYLQRQIGLTFFVLYSLLFYTFYNFDSLKILQANEKSPSS